MPDTSSATRYGRKSITKISLSLAASALALGFATAAFAQDAAPAAVPEDDTTVVIVKGVRASAIKSLGNKRKATQVVDSVVAEDIGKLPDNNVVEALQRVPGVQVTNRGGGEVGTVSIRGMSDISSTWNGRTVFTSSGRYESLQDIPATLVRQVDVYKTRDASQSEAGLAGAINVISLRPLDFKGPEISVAASGTYLDPAKKWNPQVSALFSDRWSTSHGEFGALVNLSYNKTNYRNESVTPGALVPFTTEDPMPGYSSLERIFSGWSPGLQEGLPEAEGSTLDFLSTGTGYEYYLSRDAVFQDDVTGERQRPSANIALQWQPNENATYTFEAMYNGYRDASYSNLLFSYVDGWWSNPADSITLYPGTNIMKTRTVGSVYGFNSGDYTTSSTDSYVYALNGDWHIGDKLHLIGDLSYQNSVYNTQFTAMQITRTANQINVDFNCEDNEMCFSFDDNSLLTDPSQWTVGSFYDNAGRTEGKAATLSLDGTYDANWGPVTRLTFGVRYDDRQAQEYTRGQTAYLGQALTNFDSGMQYTVSDFWSGESDVPTSWLSPNEYWIRDHLEEVRSWYAAADSTFRTGDELWMHKTFDVDEKTASLYLMADTENQILGHHLHGNFGLRYTTVDTGMTFYNWDTVNYTYSDTGNSKKTTSKVLPSVTLRYDAADDVVLRVNYGETLRRPNFGDLNPILSLSDDLTKVGYGGGSSGNSDLDATYSKNLDLTAEWYFQKDAAVYATVFNRNIDGLVVTIRQKIHVDHDEDPFYNSVSGKYDHSNGYDYVVTRPVNASDGKMSGAELGFTYFPKGVLPGILDGLGFQGSLTALSSSQNVPVTDDEGNIVSELKSAFYGISRYSYNATLAYDKGPFNARLSYVWRSAFLSSASASTFANPIGIWRHPESDLDLQFTYNVNDRLSFDVNAKNLTNEKQQEYYHYGTEGDPTTTNMGTLLIGRSVSFGFRWKM